MEFVKYYTNPTFDREGFVEMLRLKMNVRAKAMEDGIILDREAFNAISPAHMPHWAYINKSNINSRLHTRPATPSEWPDLNCQYKYSLVLLSEGSSTQLEQADGLEYIKEQADECAEFWRNEDIIGIAVIDNSTGEVMHINELGY